MDSNAQKLSEQRLRPFGVVVAHRLLKEKSEIGEHCRIAYQIIAKENIVAGVRFAAIVNLVVLIGLFFMDIRHRELLFWAHGLIELPLVYLSINARASFQLARIGIVGVAFTTAAVYGYILRTNMATGAELRYIIASCSIYLALCGGLPFFIPLLGARAGVLAIVIAVSSWTFLHTAMPVPVYHVTICFFLAVSTIARFIYDSQIAYQAVLEYDFRQSVLAAERAKNERDLELAREVQGALLPTDGITSGPVSVRFHQLLHQTVGGDWLGVRKTPSGMAVVVADASGKGVQAALIVQAVQALWAEHPEGAAFDPEEWIAKVNRVLLSMSRNKPQTMTLGLLEVNGRELTYWSAGHTPAFVKVKHAADDVEILPFAARGDMLGIKARIELTPTGCEIPAGVQATVLFGSDGVFDTPSRYGPRAIEGLFAEAEARGAAFIETLAVPDDRTLVRVEVAA